MPVFQRAFWRVGRLMLHQPRPPVRRAVVHPRRQFLKRVAPIKVMDLTVFFHLHHIADLCAPQVEALRFRVKCNHSKSFTL